MKFLSPLPSPSPRARRFKGELRVRVLLAPLDLTPVELPLTFNEKQELDGCSCMLLVSLFQGAQLEVPDCPSTLFLFWYGGALVPAISIFPLIMATCCSAPVCAFSCQHRLFVLQRV